MWRAQSLIAVIGFAWLGLMAGAGHADAQTTYKIGVMGGLSGLGAQIGQWTVQGAKVGADVINASGGPVRFEIVAEDMQWNPQKAVEAFNKLVNVDHVAAVMSGGSAAVQAIAPIADQDKIVLLNIGAQAPTMAGVGKFTFSVLQLANFDVLGAGEIRLRHDEDPQGRAVLRQRRYRKVRPERVRQGFHEARRHHHVPRKFPPERHQLWSTGRQDRRNQSGCGLSGRAALGTALCRQAIARGNAQRADPELRRRGEPGIPEGGGQRGERDGVYDDVFRSNQQGPERGDVCRCVPQSLWAGSRQPHIGYGYDGIRILAAALAAAKQPGEELRKTIAETKHYPGVTGDAIFQEDGTVAKAIAIKQIKDGAFETISVVKPGS